ncbi:MAG: hypothetical protein AAGI03_09260 [Pseudomonadota bacterium]
MINQKQAGKSAHRSAGIAPAAGAKSGPLPRASRVPPRSKEQTYLAALFDGLRRSPGSSRIQVITSVPQYGVRPATRSAYTRPEDTRRLLVIRRA